MRWAVFGLVVVLAVTLQVSFFNAWRPLGIVPNIMLVAVVAAGLYNVASLAIASGLVGGLVLDLASGDDFGLRVAFYMVVALTVVAVRQLGLPADSLWMMLSIVAVGTVAFNLAILLSLPLAVLAQDSLAALQLVGTEIAWNMILAILVFMGMSLGQQLGRRSRQTKTAEISL